MSNVANLRKIYLISLNFLIHISTTKISIYQVFSPGSFLRIYIADCIPIREIRFNKNCHKYPEAEFFLKTGLLPHSTNIIKIQGIKILPKLQV